MWQMVASHRPRVGASLLMVLAEAIGWVVMPYMIGVAINDFLEGSQAGLVRLGVVGFLTLAVFSLRRIHDVRLYARVYEQLGVASMDAATGLSARTARINMLREVVDFLEHSITALIESVAALFGTLAFLALLSQQVFVGALIVTGMIIALYAATTKRTLRFNHEYNDEYERQVDILERNDSGNARRHLRLLNRWTIKLSDIDAVNYSVAFLLGIALLIYSVVSAAGDETSYGSLLSIVLYVLEFVVTVTLLPNAWQEFLRLRDILARLGDLQAEDEDGPVPG